MRLIDLPSSAQGYLKVIWKLQEWSVAPVTTSSIALAAHVTPSTASEAVKKLASQHLVTHVRYGHVTLTEQGRLLAVSMVRRHRLLETLLVTTYGYRWDQVHDEAEVLEHAVSDLFIDRIDESLGHPTRDPHGDPIPTSSGAIHVPDTISLFELEADALVRVERVSDEDPDLLRHLTEHGIGYGTTLEIRHGGPYSESVDANAGAGASSTSLGPAAQAAIRVHVLSGPPHVTV